MEVAPGTTVSCVFDYEEDETVVASFAIRQSAATVTSMHGGSVRERDIDGSTRVLESCKSPRR